MEKFTIEQGRQILALQPFSVLLGTELTLLGEGTATLELPITAQLKQQQGFVHGGVLAYLADNALTYAAGTTMGLAVLTADVKINYVRPAQGERLIARASVIHAGKNQAVARCDVFVRRAGGEEKLCACAQGSVVRVASASDPSNPPTRSSS